MKNITLVFVLLIGITIAAKAANLMEVYHQAIVSDPTFRAQEAQMRADKENLPINKALLLPNIDLNGAFTYTYNQNGTIFGTNFGDYSTNETIINLTLTQPIFNYKSWYSVKNAQAIVKQAQATLSYNSQDLMLRTATAYLNVLKAVDDLRYTEAEMRAIGDQLRMIRERYKVGLIAITDVEQAKAQYDTVRAEVITAKNMVSNRLEELREITGRFYCELAGLKGRLPLIKPCPDKINLWVKTASTQNYNLAAAYYKARAAKENIQIQRGEGLPRVDATAGYIYNHQPSVTEVITPRTIQKYFIGVGVNFPVYQGGKVTASTRQAAYQFAQATSEMEQVHRGVVAQTRKSYLGVLAGISVVRADYQAVVSAKSALKATNAAYLVGTNTIYDVLQAQSTLYDAQKTLAQDQYQYIIDLLTLKQAAGTLCPADLTIINGWLGPAVNLSAYNTSNPDFQNYLYDIPKTEHLHHSVRPLNSDKKSNKEIKTPEKVAVSTTVPSSSSSMVNSTPIPSESMVAQTPKAPQRTLKKMHPPNNGKNKPS